MKTKPLSLLSFVLIIFQIAFSQNQSCPPNIDFEVGDFSSWECFTGRTSVNSRGQNVITLNPSPPTANRHEIISAATPVQNDYYGNFPKLCPYGGKYSVKLGNEQTGAEAEGLSYTFVVPTTVDTFTFTYFYAVVFEDPRHATYEQPRFFVTAYEVATGNIINCASYNYVSNGAIPGFEVSPLRSDVVFKNWSPASLQFAGLAGQTVRLEFKTADCTLSGHFGYAYVDVGSACSNILATAPYCRETNSLVLNAPYGFKTYTWYNQDLTTVVGNQRTLTLTPPPDTSGVFHVDVEPYTGYGCRDTLKAVVTPLPVPDTPVAKTDYAYCQFQSVSPLTATPTPGNELLWYTSATGGTGSSVAPTPSTAAAGVFYYYVSQKVLFGCESFRRKITVTIVPTPVTSFTINTVRQCQNGNQYIFTSTTTNRQNFVYNWDFGNGQTQLAGDSITTYTYPASGTFNVKLKVVNHGICSSEKNLPVTVVPKPLADFGYPAVICEKQTLVNLTDKSSVPGGVAAINQWWWSIDGAIVQTQTPSFTPNNPGPLPVKLVVTTTEGCRSDSSTALLQVHYRPGSAFKYSIPLCNNEVIRFTDLSAMPQAAAPESIVKWYWNFDNTANSTIQHPPMHFVAGTHNARLITETDFGCKSIQADSSFVIHAKPTIQLAINDSCVFRTIKYEAIDVSNTVNTWYWNFGNGFINGSTLITRTYNKEGYRPLTLMAETINGCKDTIIRPFTIYDNKAFAGRDTVVAKDEPVQLNARGGATVKYVWSPSIGLNDPHIENPIATWDQDQRYQLDAITKEGCDSHSSIFIKRYKGPELYIPNAFTPNGDGKNDVLRVFPVGMKTFKVLIIYNRYGEVIYKTTDHTLGWDGTYRGMLQSTGTYIAVAQALDYKGRPMLQKVAVTLIR